MVANKVAWLVMVTAGNSMVEATRMEPQRSLISSKLYLGAVLIFEVLAS